MIDHGADLESRGYRLIATLEPLDEGEAGSGVIRGLSAAHPPVDAEGARAPWERVHRDVRVVRQADGCEVYLRDREAATELQPCVHVLWLGPNANGYDRQDDPEDA